jgi:hypothetical protein
MTATTKTSVANNGWNAAVDALEQNKDIAAFSARIEEVQKRCKPSNTLYHYAEGAKDAIKEYETTGNIPGRA